MPADRPRTHVQQLVLKSDFIHYHVRGQMHGTPVPRWMAIEAGRQTIRPMASTSGYLRPSSEIEPSQYPPSEARQERTPPAKTLDPVPRVEDLDPPDSFLFQTRRKFGTALPWLVGLKVPHLADRGSWRNSAG